MAPLARVVDLKTFQNQTAKPKRLNEKLWHEMLRGKTLNQSRVLQHKQLRSPHLELALKQEVFDEGNCARRYWQLYFPAIGWSSSRRDRKEDTASLFPHPAPPPSPIRWAKDNVSRALTSRRRRIVFTALAHSSIG